MAVNIVFDSNYRNTSIYPSPCSYTIPESDLTTFPRTVAKAPDPISKEFDDEQLGITASNSATNVSSSSSSSTSHSSSSSRVIASSSSLFRYKTEREHKSGVSASQKTFSSSSSSSSATTGMYNLTLESLSLPAPRPELYCSNTVFVVASISGEALLLEDPSVAPSASTPDAYALAPVGTAVMFDDIPLSLPGTLRNLLYYMIPKDPVSPQFTNIAAFRVAKYQTTDPAAAEFVNTNQSWMRMKMYIFSGTDFQRYQASKALFSIPRIFITFRTPVFADSPMINTLNPETHPDTTFIVVKNDAIQKSRANEPLWIHYQSLSPQTMRFQPGSGIQVRIYDDSGATIPWFDSGYVGIGAPTARIKSLINVRLTDPNDTVVKRLVIQNTIPLALSPYPTSSAGAAFTRYHINSLHRDNTVFPNPCSFQIFTNQISTWSRHPRRKTDDPTQSSALANGSVSSRSPSLVFLDKLYFPFPRYELFAAQTIYVDSIRNFTVASVLLTRNNVPISSLVPTNTMVYFSKFPADGTTGNSTFMRKRVFRISYPVPALYAPYNTDPAAFRIFGTVGPASNDVNTDDAGDFLNIPMYAADETTAVNPQFITDTINSLALLNESRLYVQITAKTFQDINLTTSINNSLSSVTFVMIRDDVIQSDANQEEQWQSYSCLTPQIMRFQLGDELEIKVFKTDGTLVTEFTEGTTKGALNNPLKQIVLDLSVMPLLS